MGTPLQQLDPNTQRVFCAGCCATLLGMLSGAVFGGLSGWRLTDVVPFDAVAPLGGLWGGVIAGITSAAFAGRKAPEPRAASTLAPGVAMMVAAIFGGLTGVLAGLLGDGLEWRPGTALEEEYLPLVGTGVGALCGAVGGLLGGAFGAAAAAGEYL